MFFYVRRVEHTSRLDRVTIDTGTPRPREPERSGPPGDARGVASRFAGERRATYPVTTPRWLSARWCTPSCRSGRRLRGRGGSSVGPSVGTSEARARERGGERTARLTRQREYRQRRDRLPVSCGRPRLRHDRLSGARARGAPLVLSRDVSRQQWRSHEKSRRAAVCKLVENRKNSFDRSSIVPTGPSIRRDRASPRADRAGRRGLVPARQPAAARRGSRRGRQKSSLPPLRIELRTS